MRTQTRGSKRAIRTHNTHTLSARRNPPITVSTRNKHELAIYRNTEKGSEREGEREEETGEDDALTSCEPKHMERKCSEEGKGTQHNDLSSRALNEKTQCKRPQK